VTVCCDRHQEARNLSPLTFMIGQGTHMTTRAKLRKSQILDFSPLGLQVGFMILGRV
jgi:hypothetical protein